MGKVIKRLVTKLKSGNPVTQLEKQTLLLEGFCPNLYCGRKSILHLQTTKKDVHMCNKCGFQQIQYM